MRVAVPENGHFFVRRIDFEKLSSCGAVDVAVQADLKIHPACQVMQVRELFLAVYDLSGFRVVDEQRALRKAPDVSVRSDEEGSDRRLARDGRSEEHTSELQSRENLVCRLLLEK